MKQCVDCQTKIGKHEGHRIIVYDKNHNETARGYFCNDCYSKHKLSFLKN